MNILESTVYVISQLIFFRGTEISQVALKQYIFKSLADNFDKNCNTTDSLLDMHNLLRTPDRDAKQGSKFWA